MAETIGNVIYLVWKQLSKEYDFELKFKQFDNGDYGTQARDHLYELLMTGDDEKVIIDSVKYSDEHPCRYHAHYRNHIIESQPNHDKDEDPAVWAHCTECHADDWEHYGINGPRCGHYAGCPNC